MVVKVKGPFTWHKHDETDDFFLVLKGRITIQMREGNVTLGPGEMFVVPRGVEHCPVADDEAHLLLIEPTGTPNTGDSPTAARRVVNGRRQALLVCALPLVNLSEYSRLRISKIIDL